MTYAERNCAHCGNPFTPNRKDKKYCSKKCGFDAFKLRESQTIEPENNGLGKTAEKSSIPDRVMPSLGNLDVASQYVIGHQGDTIKELKDEIKTLRIKEEKLHDEKRELEKEITQLKNQINQKPSALAGIVQSDKFPEMIMEGLATVKEMFAAQRQPQLNGAEKNPLIEWLAKQPMEIQNEFVKIMNSLMQIEDTAQVLSNLQSMSEQMSAGGKRAAY